MELVDLLKFVGFVCLGLVIRDYLPVYTKKKAEYKAMREEIENITKLVGEVNHKFDESLSKLNTRNSVIQGRLVQYNSRRDSVLFTLYETGYRLMEDLLSYGYDLDEKEIIDETHLRNHIRICERSYTEYNSLRLMAVNWFQDQNLKDAIDKFSKIIMIHLLALHEIDNELRNFLSVNASRIVKEDLEKRAEYIKLKQELLVGYISDTNDSRKEYSRALEILLNEVLICYEDIEKQLIDA